MYLLSNQELIRGHWVWEKGCYHVGVQTHCIPQPNLPISWGGGVSFDVNIVIMATSMGKTVLLKGGAIMAALHWISACSFCFLCFLYPDSEPERNSESDSWSEVLIGGVLTFIVKTVVVVLDATPTAWWNLTCILKKWGVKNAINGRGVGSRTFTQTIYLLGVICAGIICATVTTTC